MVQFLAPGLQIPADHPDRKKYYSLSFRHLLRQNGDAALIDEKTVFIVKRT